MAEQKPGHWFSEEKVQALIARFKSGDMDAFEEIWTTFSPYVFTIMRGRTNKTWPLGKQAAEELTSVTMERVLEKLGTYESRPGASFVSWLHTVAVNLKRSELERCSKAAEDPERSLDEEDSLTQEPLYTRVADKSDPQPSDAIIVAEEAASEAQKAEVLNEVIDSLSTEDKFLISARFTERLSYDEIAVKLEGSAKSAPKIRKRWERLRKDILDKITGKQTSEKLIERGGD